MALIVTAFCGRGGECFLVVAYAVFIQEVLINPVVFDELVGNSFDQGSVCTWTNRNPLIHARCNSIVVFFVAGGLRFDKIEDLAKAFLC